MHTHACAHTHPYTFAHIHTDTCAHTDMHTYTPMHMCTDTCTHMRVHAHTSMHTWAQTHVCTHTPMYINTRVCAHTSTCTYMYTHTQCRGSPARSLGLRVAPNCRGGLGTGPCPPHSGFTASGAHAPERDPDPRGHLPLKEHQLPPAAVGPAGSHLQRRPRRPGDRRC